MAPPLPAGALSPPTGVLAKPAKQLRSSIKALDPSFTQVTDAGCAALAAALESGTLPALERLYLYGTPASEAAKHALMARLPARSIRLRLGRGVAHPPPPPLPPPPFPRGTT